MTRLRVFLGLMATIALTVPWMFSETQETEIFGLPTWALWVIISTVALAIMTAFGLQRSWEVMSNEGDDSDENKIG